MSYIKEILTPQTTVAGNIQDFNQSYEVFYYPKAQELIDKIAIYIHLINKEGKAYGKRSLYFSSHEQLRNLILELTKSYFYFRDKRTNPMVSRDIWRKAILREFSASLQDKQMKLWSKEIPKKNINYI